MPFALRQSGPSFERDGQTITPRAMISTCETCGYIGAPFGFVDPVTGHKTAWCGWRNGEPVCVGRGNAQDLFGAAA